MSREEVDRTLDQLGKDSDRIAAALLDLDSHPGHLFLRGNTRLSGRTARSWAGAQAEMATLWSRFDLYRGALDRARALRAQAHRPSQELLAELTEQLRGRSVELSCEQVPIEERSLTGPTEVRQWASLTELVDGMNTAYAHVADVVAAVDQAWSALAARFTPVEDAWRALSTQADSLGVPTGGGPLARDLARCGDELAALRETAFCDPLALHDPSGAGGAAGGLSQVESQLAGLHGRVAAVAQVRDEFDARVDRLRTRLGEVDAVRAETQRVWLDVLAKIAAPGAPPPTGPVVSVRDELAALAAVRASGQWQQLADQMSTLEHQVAELHDAAQVALRETTELLDRRTELRGRLEAYRAMARRQGRAEDAELAAYHEAARDLLWAAPCDLRAATRAVARYQQAVRGGGAGTPASPSRPGTAPRGAT